MKQIKFDDVTFNLASDVSVTFDRLAAGIIREEGVTVEDVDNAAYNATVITILEESEVIATYRGYTTLIGTGLTRNVVIDQQGTTVDMIQVTLLNTDFQAQLEQLSNGLSQVESAQSAQASAISTLTEEVSSKVDSSVIGDVETIGALAKKPYEVGETFMGDDGKYYKVTAPIMVESVLVIGGNCEETNVAAEISAE